MSNIYFLLSIPIIYILYVCSVIKKELVKRERDQNMYCKKEVMEMETLRHYIVKESSKKELRNIFIAACIFLITVVLTVVSIIIVTIDQLPIFIVLFVLSIILLINIIKVKTPSPDTIAYKNDINTIFENLRTILQDYYKKTGRESIFKRLPSEFVVPFVERWVFTENKTDIKTFKTRLEEIDEFYDKFNDDDKVYHFIGLMKPYDGEDINYVYKTLRSLNRTPLPDLTKYPLTYYTVKNIEIIGWIILVFIYYNIFHKYYKNTDVIVAIIISMIILMFMYYLIITKDTL